MLVREKALELTRVKVATSVNEDNHIMQSISAMEDLDKAANLLIRRLREWYELYSPEFSRSIGDNEAFARLILEKNRDEQMAEIKVTKTMGADFKKEDLAVMESTARTITQLYEQRHVLENYIESVMNNYAPNLLILAGATSGARLLREAGSLKRLSSIQASTIQMYGAEKALFRHLKTGAKPPKHGYIINHPLLAAARPQDKGKVARALADKISIACKVDYFKGELVGQQLRDDLEKRFGGEKQ